MSGNPHDLCLQLEVLKSRVPPRLSLLVCMEELELGCRPYHLQEGHGEAERSLGEQ